LYSSFWAFLKFSWRLSSCTIPSLARRFACCQSCSVSAPFGLTALTALRSVLLKNRRWVRKKNILFPFNQLYFLKSYKQVGEVNLEVSSQLEFSLKTNCGLPVLKNDFFRTLKSKMCWKFIYLWQEFVNTINNSKIKTWPPEVPLVQLKISQHLHQYTFRKCFNRPQALTISATSLQRRCRETGVRFNRPQALTISATVPLFVTDKYFDPEFQLPSSSYH